MLHICNQMKDFQWCSGEGVALESVIRGPSYTNNVKSMAKWKTAGSPVR